MNGMEGMKKVEKSLHRPKRGAVRAADYTDRGDFWGTAGLGFVFSVCLRAQGIFQIHRYIQGRFTNQEGTPERLENRRARLILSGDPLSKLSGNLVQRTCFQYEGHCPLFFAPGLTVRSRA